MQNELLIKSEGIIEKKLQQIPLQDIAIFLGYSEKDIKENYPGISETFNYQTVKLFTNSDMINLNYFQRYELLSFNSAFSFKVISFTDHNCTSDFSIGEF